MSAIANRARKVVSEVCGCAENEIDYKSKLGEDLDIGTGWSGEFEIQELYLSLEEEFGITLPTRAFLSVREFRAATFGDIIKLLEYCLNTQPRPNQVSS